MTTLDYAEFVPVRTFITVLERATEEQKEAIRNRLRNHSNIDYIDVVLGGFDLPTGYLGFKVHYKDGGRLVGGIAPNGDVST